MFCDDQSQALIKIYEETTIKRTGDFTKIKMVNMRQISICKIGSKKLLTRVYFCGERSTRDQLLVKGDVYDVINSF